MYFTRDKHVENLYLFSAINSTYWSKLWLLTNLVLLYNNNSNIKYIQYKWLYCNTTFDCYYYRGRFSRIKGASQESDAPYSLGILPFMTFNGNCAAHLSSTMYTLTEIGTVRRTEMNKKYSGVLRHGSCTVKAVLGYFGCTAKTTYTQISLNFAQRLLAL